MSFTPTVDALQVLPVIDAFERLSLPVESLLVQAQLSRAALSQPGARVSLDSEFKLWTAACAHSGDPALGLRVAEQLKPGATGSFEYMLRHSENLEQLLTRAQRFGRLADELLELTWQTTHGVVEVTIGRMGNHPTPGSATECLFAVAMLATRSLYPGHVPIGIDFMHHSKADPAQYRKYFGCPVRFGTGHNRLSFHAALLQRPAQNVDGQLGQVMEDHTAHLLSQLPSHTDFVAQARQRLLALLPRGEASLDALARTLHVSERTLRRRLSAEGTSFQQLLDELRREQALAHVANDQLSLEQLADTLGFLDMSTFHRAFKRWTGQTPGRYREQRKRK